MKKYLKKGDIVVAQGARCKNIGATDNHELELDGFPDDADLPPARSLSLTQLESKRALRSLRRQRARLTKNLS